MTTNALHYAASTGTLEMVEQRLHEYDVNEPDNWGRTAFHRAAYAGDVDKMKLLKNHNASFTSADKYGRTALHLAAKQNCVEAVEYLVELGVDVQARDNHGRPGHAKGYLRQAHHLAAKNGALGTLWVLLDHPEVNINELDGFDHTAYYFAHYRDKTEAMELLLEKGADPNAGSWTD